MWTTSSIKLDLQDVTVHLEPVHGASSLACINFIKSRLVLETYSDMGQDIDLVSQASWPPVLTSFTYRVSCPNADIKVEKETICEVTSHINNSVT